MKKYLYGFLCIMLFVFVLPARAQETPQATSESAETESVASEEIVAAVTPDEPASEQTESSETESEDPSISGGASGDESTVDESSLEETENAESEIESEEMPEADATTTETDNIPAIYISEVNWAGSEFSQSDEWIELYNASGETVDLSGWILTGCATSADALALADGTTLAAGGVLLVSNYDLGNEKTTLNVQPNLVTASVSLSNSALEIMLVMPDGTVVDSAGDGSAPPAGSTDPKASMVRDLGSLEWHTADQSSNLLSQDQLGTPGTLYGIDIQNDEPEAEIINDPLHLIINEFMSDPDEEGQEWIEVFNPTESEVGLEGYLIQDTTERTSAFEQDSIAAGTYAVLYSPSGQLNNGGDTIQLIDSNGFILDQITYGTETIPAPQKGYALAWIEDSWQVTAEPTPGSVNIYTEEQLAPDETGENTTNESDESQDTETESKGMEEQLNEEQGEETNTETDASNSLNQNELKSFSPGTIIITEVVSDPSDSEPEWIEFFNTTTTAVDLTGWFVTDVSEKQTELTGVIDPNSYLVLEAPKGKLNNDGDSIYLYDPSGNLIDQMSYGTGEVKVPNKGESLSFIDGIWTITTEISKASPNTIIYEEEQTTNTDLEDESAESDEQPSTSSNNTTNTSNDQQTQQTAISNNQQTSEGNDNDVSNQSIDTTTHRVVAIAETPKATSSSSSSSTKASSSGTSAQQTTMSGVVTATPGTFGSQVTFIEGMQLYFYYADWPLLHEGDVVTVTGELSESRGEERLKLSETGDVQVTGHTDLYATTASMNGLDEIKDGNLVTVRGEVKDMSDTKILLQGSTGDIIVVASDDMQWETMNSELEITGVLRTISGEQRIYVRKAQDVTQIVGETPEEAQHETPAVAGQTKNITPWIGGGLILFTLGGLVYFFLKRESLQTAPAGA